MWMAKEDGSHQVQVTHSNGSLVGNLQWSPDGRRLAFDSRFQGQSAVFVMECDAAGMRYGEQKRVKSDIPAMAASWSADGESIYFASERTGRWEIWEQPAAGGPSK
jgi:Tol biopolymer transport system component